MDSPDVCTGRRDDRAAQCVRAADFIEAHPGCSARAIGEGADLGSATKVISEMRRYGYLVRKERASVPCLGGTRVRRGAVRYYLEARPGRVQRDFFADE